MRFIGSKKNMIQNIDYVIRENINEKVNVFFEPFAGTGIVSEMYKNKYRIIANDILTFSSILLYARFCITKLPKFENLIKIGVNNPLEYFNGIEFSDIDIKENFFITKNYSPYEECTRMYFQVKNAVKIDFIRQKIDEWYKLQLITEEEKIYLIASLLDAIPYISNITGTYGAYLKKWDKRAYKELELKHLDIDNNGHSNLVYNLNANELVKNVYADICYIDPPYNSRQYNSNYHLLETVAKYDSPVIRGITGNRADNINNRSLYCIKKAVISEFDDLIKNINSKYIIVSYSSDGLMSEKEIEIILKKYTNKTRYKIYKFPYRKYRGKLEHNNSNLTEYIFFSIKD